MTNSANSHHLRARLLSAAAGDGRQGRAAAVTLDAAESRALLDLIEAAEAASRAITPVLTGDRHERRRWWSVLPELERAQLELTRALSALTRP